MAERSDVFKAFRENVAEHAHIGRVIAGQLTSMDETACRGRETVAESRELLVKADKQFGPG